MTPTCESCRWFYDDDRDTIYRRGRCCFCKRKPYPFSRQHKPGEGSRIDPKGCCEHYEKAEKEKTSL